VGGAGRSHQEPADELTIHVVGKYTGYEDSYKSLNEAVFHGGFAHR
jgi:CTP synthase